MSGSHSLKSLDLGAVVIHSSTAHCKECASGIVMLRGCSGSMAYGIWKSNFAVSLGSLPPQLCEPAV